MPAPEPRAQRETGTPKETNETESGAPEITAPGTEAPESSTPETRAPEARTPENTAPEASAPDTTTPEATVPDTVAPEIAAPEASAPESVAPETAPPDTTDTDTRWQARFAAFAYSEEEVAWGTAWEYDSQGDANNAALESCGVSDCEVRKEIEPDQCFAVVHGQPGYVSWGWGASQAIATEEAINRCTSDGEKPCTVQDGAGGTFCNTQ